MQKNYHLIKADQTLVPLMVTRTYAKGGREVLLKLGFHLLR
jgi:hypothetical protein